MISFYQKKLKLAETAQNWSINHSDTCLLSAIVDFWYRISVDGVEPQGKPWYPYEKSFSWNPKYVWSPRYSSLVGKMVKIISS